MHTLLQAGPGGSDAALRDLLANRTSSGHAPASKKLPSTPGTQARNSVTHEDGFHDVDLGDDGEGGNTAGAGANGAARANGHRMAPDLAAENAALRQRLQAVEDAAAEALGELEDVQVRKAPLKLQFPSAPHVTSGHVSWHETIAQYIGCLI